MKHVLVAYDGSSAARRALAHAADLARPGDVVSVVTVMPEPAVSARIEPPSEGRHRQRLVLDEALHFLAHRGFEARAAAPVGEAAAEILATADRLGTDVIVVGRHRERIPHLLGSISGHLVRSAPCDVLVVHEKRGPEAAPHGTG